jgi:hypothetical protein
VPHSKSAALIAHTRLQKSTSTAIHRHGFPAIIGKVYGSALTLTEGSRVIVRGTALIRSGADLIGVAIGAAICHAPVIEDHIAATPLAGRYRIEGTRTRTFYGARLTAVIEHVFVCGLTAVRVCVQS